MCSDLLTKNEIDKLPFRGRGLNEFARFIGDIKTLVTNSPFEKVRILEIGCGYGQALIELALEFGSKVELHGINHHNEKNYDLSLALRVAKYRGITPEKLRLSDGQVTIVHADAGKNLPYPDGFFHLVISQMTVVFVPEKAKLIEEVARITHPKGIGLLHCEFVRKKLPTEFKSSLDIYEGNNLIGVTAYLQRFPCLNYESTKKGDVLRVRANRQLALRLSLASHLDLKSLNKEWYGVKSIYNVTGS